METHYLLTCNRLPARVDAEGAAVLLGFKEHDLPVLIGEKLLKPLGKPGQRSVKYFSTAQLLEFGRDAAWLEKATRAISESWRERNAGKCADGQPAFPTHGLGS